MWGEPPVTGGFPSQGPVTQSFVNVTIERYVDEWLIPNSTGHWAIIVKHRGKKGINIIDQPTAH